MKLAGNQLIVYLGETTRNSKTLFEGNCILGATYMDIHKMGGGIGFTVFYSISTTDIEPG